jgi:hypothetical protein
LHLALQQHERLLDQRREIGWREFLAAVAGHPQDAVGDFFGAGSGGEDAIERLVASRFVFVPQAQLGVVDDRHQHVVEFVRRGPGELAEGGHPLGAEQFLLESR